MRGFAGSRVRGFAGSRVRRFAGSRVRRFAGSRVRGFTGSRVRGLAGSQLRGFAGSRVHGFAGSRARGIAGSRVRGVRGFAGSRAAPFGYKARRRVLCLQGMKSLFFFALWSAYALPTQLWFGHGCSVDRMLSEHERKYGLGMDALVIVYPKPYLIVSILRATYVKFQVYECVVLLLMHGLQNPYMVLVREQASFCKGNVERNAVILHGHGRRQLRQSILHLDTF